MNGRELYDKGRHHYDPPSPDMWDKLPEREKATYEWLCWEHNRRVSDEGKVELFGEHPISVVPNDKKQQFTTMTQVLGNALLRVGGTDFTDWKHWQVEEKDERTVLSMDFQLGENAFYLVLAADHVPRASSDIRWKTPSCA